MGDDRSGSDGTLSKSEQMARVRNEDTEPELILRKALWREGFRYRIHPDLPGTPDFAFPGPQVAVFVDGCFWHGCPEHYTAPESNEEFWANKLERNLARDERVDEELAEMGWTVVRVWEHRVKNDLDGAVEKVAEAVSKNTA